MTLILSHLSRAFVLQVTDRLVVAKRNNTILHPFDALANKNLIYLARDAIVSIGYTGPAYIGKLPTDDWIAEKLTGVNVSERFGIKFGPLPQWLDIGQATRLLAQELEGSEIAAQNLSFELVAVGWQWKSVRRLLDGRYQPVPMAWGLSKPEGGRFDKKVERLPRQWHRKHESFFHASPTSNLPKAERDKMLNRLRSEASLNAAAKTTVEIADRVEQATVDTIRSVSASNQFVGPNCMSVLLAPPHQSALVRVTFFPQEQHSARLIGKNFRSPDFPAAFSPWIIGQSAMQKPAVHIGQGSWDIQMGLFTVTLNGPGGQGGVHGMSSQRRPARPSR